jgi:uncharacterized protein (DUF1499 family)
LKISGKNQKPGRQGGLINAPIGITTQVSKQIHTIEKAFFMPKKGKICQVLMIIQDSIPREKAG